MNTDKTAILNELNRRVHGHLKAKKALITAVERSKYRHYQKYVIDEEKENVVAPLNVLLIGKSGTGKTFLMRQLSDIMDFPLYVLDATQITPSGNSDGKNLNKIKSELREYAKALVQEHPDQYFSTAGALSQIVVFVDEIDKLANSFDSSGRWNAQVQANLLTLVDNGEEFEGLTFVFAGSFSAVESKRVSRDIGFHSSAVKETFEAEALTDEQIIKAGMIPELVGRISLIVNLEKFTKADYRAILDENILPKMEKNFSHIDVELDADTIIDKAMESSQGVRFLTRAVNDAYLEKEFDSEYTYGPKLEM